MTPNLQDLGLFLPEIFMILTIVALFGVDLMTPKKKVAAWVALGGLSLALVTNIYFEAQGIQGAAFSAMLAIDPLGTIFKHIFIATTIITIFTSLWSTELPEKYLGEYFVLLVTSCLGLGLMASANDLLTMFLGIETVSVLSYAMAGFRLNDRKGSEAALKYVVYGGAASGLMLFGMSLFYGLFGTTQFTGIYEAILQWNLQQVDVVAQNGAYFPLTIMMAFVMIFAGIGYKIAIVPFHMWTPDVYEGSPTPVTAFFAVGPKAAGFALLTRFIVACFVAPGTLNGFATNPDTGRMELALQLPIPAMLGALAAATMIFGTLAAIPQRNVKRLLAYSSIAHAGYILMGFVVLSQDSLEAVLFYVLAYYMMNLGAFVILQAVRDDRHGDDLEHFRGLGVQRPSAAILMTLFLASMFGFPPLVGLFAKWYIFAAVLKPPLAGWLVALAIVGALMGAISFYPYFKIVRAMWFEKDRHEKPLVFQTRYLVMATVLAVPTVLIAMGPLDLVRSTIRQNIAVHRSHIDGPNMAQTQDLKSEQPALAAEAQASHR